MGKKKKKLKIDLLPNEQVELESIVEILKLQHPEGEAFNNFLESLIERLSKNDKLLAALVDRIATEPSEGGVEVFKKIKDRIPPCYKRIVKRASFKLEQKGYLKGEHTPNEAPSDSTKIVLIPTPTEVQEASAAVFFDHFRYPRVFMVLLPPTPATEASLIVVTESLYSHKLEGYITYGSKNELNTVIKEMKSQYENYEMPPYHVAQLIINRIEVFSNRMKAGNREKLFETKRILKELLPDDPEKFFKENFKKGDIESSVTLSETIKEVRKFEIDDKESFLDLMLSIEPLLNPTVECTTETKQYQIEKKIVEFFKNLNEFSLKRYYLFLIEESSRLIAASDIPIAKRLYDIAQCVKNGNFEKISQFLFKHVLFLIFREAFFLGAGDANYYENIPYSRLFGGKTDLIKSWATDIGKKSMEFLSDVIDFGINENITSEVRQDEETDGFKRLESGLYIPD